MGLGMDQLCAPYEPWYTPWSYAMGVWFTSGILCCMLLLALALVTYHWYRAYSCRRVLPYEQAMRDLAQLGLLIDQRVQTCAQTYMCLCAIIKCYLSDAHGMSLRGKTDAEAIARLVNAVAFDVRAADVFQRVFLHAPLVKFAHLSAGIENLNADMADVMGAIGVLHEAQGASSHHS